MGHPWDNLYYKNEGKGDAVSCLIAKYPDCLSYCVINDRNPTVGADTPDSALPEAYREKIDKKWYVYKCRPLIGTKTVLRDNTAYCGESTKLNLVPDDDFCNNNISRAKLLVSKNFFLDRVEEQGTRYWQGDIVYKGAKIDDGLDYDYNWIGEVAIEVRPAIRNFRIATIAKIQTSPYYGLILAGSSEIPQQSRVNGVGTLCYDVHRALSKGEALRVPYSYPDSMCTLQYKEKTSKPHLLVIDGDRTDHCQVLFESYGNFLIKDNYFVYPVEVDSVVDTCYAPWVRQPFYRDSKLDWCSCGYHILSYLRNYIDGTQESLLKQVQYANCYNNRPCGYSVSGSNRVGVYENAILLKTNATNIMYCYSWHQSDFVAGGRLRYLDTIVDSNIPFDNCSCGCYSCCYNCGTCYNCYCGCYSCSYACAECFRKGRVNETNPVLGYLVQAVITPTYETRALITVKDYCGYNSRLELYLSRFWMGLQAVKLTYHLSGQKLFEWDEATEEERKEQILAGGYSTGSQNRIEIVLWNVKSGVRDVFWYTNKSVTPMSATIENGRFSFSIYDMLVSMGKENATSEEMAEALESVDIFIVVGCKTADAIILNYDESKIWEGMYPIGNIVENWMPSN